MSNLHVPPPVGPTDLERILNQFRQDIYKAGRGADTGWIAPTLLNSWVHFGSSYATPGYRRINGIVYLKGLIKNGTLVQNAFVLPAGFRPDLRRLYVVAHNGFGTVEVAPDGSVLPTGASNVHCSLDGISFPADQ